MCAYVVEWNEANPIGSTTNANTIDTELQDLKKSVRERMNQLLDSSTAWETDGDDPKLLDVGAIAGQPDVAVAFSDSSLTLVTATPLILLWDNETLDTGNPTTEFHDKDGGANSGRMTITTAGYYRLVGSIQVTAGANAGDVTLRLKKNGTAIRVVLAPVISADNTTLYINEVVLAAAVDYYELEGEQSTGVNMSVIGGGTISSFSIERINGTT